MKTIVVLGVGLAGAPQTAGKIGYQYGRKGKKEVYFAYNNELPFSPAVVENDRDSRDTILELRHADGTTETLTAPAYLPTTGMAPNTSFVLKSMLDKNGYIRRSPFLRADGYKNIFVVGDAGNVEDNRALAADAQAGHLIKVFPAYFESGSLPEYKVNGKTMYGIPLGQMGGMKVFSWLIWWFKGHARSGDIRAQKYLKHNALVTIAQARRRPTDSTRLEGGRAPSLGALAIVVSSRPGLMM